MSPIKKLTNCEYYADINVSATERYIRFKKQKRIIHLICILCGIAVFLIFFMFSRDRLVNVCFGILAGILAEGLLYYPCLKNIAIYDKIRREKLGEYLEERKRRGDL